MHNELGVYKQFVFQVPVTKQNNIIIQGQEITVITVFLWLNVKINL